MAPLKKIDGLRMFAGACFHGANDCGLVGDGRTFGHEFAEVNSGDGSRDGSERAAGRRARFGVPRFKLTGATAQPEEDAPFLCFFCSLCKSRIGKQARPAERGNGACRHSLEKTPPVKAMLRIATILSGPVH